MLNDNRKTGYRFISFTILPQRKLHYDDQQCQKTSIHEIFLLQSSGLPNVSEAVLGLKMRSPITVILEWASFAGCESSHSHTWEKSRSKKERQAQAIFRQTRTEASRRRRTGRQSALSTLTFERNGRGDEHFFQGGLPR